MSSEPQRDTGSGGAGARSGGGAGGGAGAAPGAGKPVDESEDSADQAALARQYRQAAQGDAHHERASGPVSGTEAPTLVTTPETPHMPMTDVARPDKADGENYAAPPSDKGPDYDRLMRGLEPGETSAD